MIVMLAINENIPAAKNWIRNLLMRSVFERCFYLSDGSIENTRKLAIWNSDQSPIHNTAMICSAYRIDIVRKRGKLWSRILLSKSPFTFAYFGQRFNKKRLKKLNLSYKKRKKKKKYKTLRETEFIWNAEISYIFFLSAQLLYVRWRACSIIKMSWLRHTHTDAIAS